MRIQPYLVFVDIHTDIPWTRIFEVETWETLSLTTNGEYNGDDKMYAPPHSDLRRGGSGGGGAEATDIQT